GRLQGKLTNRPMMMQSAGNLGSACWMMGNMKGATGYYEQALVLSREIEDKAGESRWVGNLGNVAYVMGNSEQAIPYYTQALDLARQIQDKKLIGTWLNNLSTIY
ncbi:MAG TPA: tetratricopeptide repeat protein, partial [Aggregatilineales bacterium]|nr:tetratricopeptide repeat protein [Aggregatilineales bacterium]